MYDAKTEGKMRNIKQEKLQRNKKYNAVIKNKMKK